MKLPEVRPLGLVREIVQEWLQKRVVEGATAKYKRCHFQQQHQLAFNLIQDQLLFLACSPNQQSIGTFNEMVKAMFRPTFN